MKEGERQKVVKSLETLSAIHLSSFQKGNFEGRFWAFKPGFKPKIFQESQTKKFSFPC